jgi:tRNA pseudouridine38-40 synthase
VTIKMTLAYVGTRYAGWQIQPQHPTIQGILEDRLGRLLQEKVTLFGAGRTDSGVHALGQVASFTTERRMPLDGLRRGLNARLPEDIRVLAAEPVADAFHARSDARGKEYAYRYSRGEVTSPFRAPFVCPVRGRLDLDAMRRGAAGFEGRHDFTSLAPASIELEDRVRTITSIGIEDEGEEVVLRVRGDGFLRHMVRTIAGTLLDIAGGRRDAADVPGLLEARDRRAAGPCAPARGLTLVRVFYAEANA